MIHLEHVTKTFKTKDGDVHAVKDVSLNIEEGEIYGIIGFSGAGREFGFDGTYSSLGRHLLHHFSDDDVYQQYSYGCADGSYCPGGGPAGRSESLFLPLCGYVGRQHVLCLSVLHAS